MGKEVKQQMVTRRGFIIALIGIVITSLAVGTAIGSLVFPKVIEIPVTAGTVTATKTVTVSTTEMKTVTVPTTEMKTVTVPTTGTTTVTVPTTETKTITGSAITVTTTVTAKGVTTTTTTTIIGD